MDGSVNCGPWSLKFGAGSLGEGPCRGPMFFRVPHSSAEPEGTSTS